MIWLFMSDLIACCMSLALLLPGTSPIVLTQRGKKSRLTLAVHKKKVRICAVCARQWGRRFTALSHTPSSTRNFHTHHLSHATLSYALPHTTFTHTIFYTQLCHTKFVYLWILQHLLFFSILPHPATTFVAHYWKKLTCGVIRSFNLHPPASIWFTPPVSQFTISFNFQTSMSLEPFTSAWHNSLATCWRARSGKTKFCD